MEWQEYQAYLESVQGEAGESDASRRIDLMGKVEQRSDPRYGRIDVYEVDGRLLYPASDCAKLLKLNNPRPMASACPHKELWQIKALRGKLADGTPSYQIACKNFIPAQDVERLARSSGDPEANVIRDWILAREDKKEAVK